MSAAAAMSTGNAPGGAMPDSLGFGIALLDEQRDAMLARDAARIEAANARLSAWLAACRDADTRPAGSAERLQALRATLDANSTLARRSARQASRGLEALVASESSTYTDKGLASAPSRRREATRA